jgi:hypothetical protein
LNGGGEVFRAGVVVRCQKRKPPQRDLPISWNIAPTQDVPAIRLHPETKQRTLDVLRWGLIPYWAKDPKIAYKRIENGRYGTRSRTGNRLNRQRQTNSGISTPKLAARSFPAKWDVGGSFLKYSIKKVDFYLNNK